MEREVDSNAKEVIPRRPASLSTSVERDLAPRVRKLHTYRGNRGAGRDGRAEE